MLHKILIIAVLVASLCTSEIGLTTECSAIDLRSQPNGPFSQLITESQGSHGTCYAYAASSMYNYSSIQREGFDIDQVSPLELAAIDSHPSSAGSLSSGNPTTALRALQRQGSYCPRQHLVSWLNEHIGPGSEAMIISILQGSLSETARQDFMSRVREFRINYDRLQAEDTFAIPPSGLSGASLARARIRRDQLIQSRARQFAEEMLPDCVSCEPRGPLRHITEHFEFLNNISNWLVNHQEADEKSIFKQIISFACRDHRQELPFIPSLHVENSPSNSIFISSLNRILERSNTIPPSLSMCATVFNQPSYNGIAVRNGHRSYRNRQDCRSHSILVIARRNNPNRGCEYLIRNSWGITPGGNYHSSYQFEDGGVWMSEDQIKRSALEIISVSPRS